jgi:hypothetical protein
MAFPYFQFVSGPVFFLVVKSRKHFNLSRMSSLEPQNISSISLANAAGHAVFGSGLEAVSYPKDGVSFYADEILAATIPAHVVEAVRFNPMEQFKADATQLPACDLPQPNANASSPPQPNANASFPPSFMYAHESATGQFGVGAVKSSEEGRKSTKKRTRKKVSERFTRKTKRLALDVDDEGTVKEGTYSDSLQRLRRNAAHCFMSTANVQQQWYEAYGTRDSFLYALRDISQH